jgi:hypothetical protein
MEVDMSATQVSSGAGDRNWPDRYALYMVREQADAEFPS